MAYFKELDEILNISISMLLENDNICKLLHYYPDTQNLKFNPIAQPKVENPHSLLLNKIYPMPKMPDVETGQICFVDVNLAGGEKMLNTGFRRVELIFDVVCHLDSWIIKGGYRPLKVMAEIDSLFNNQSSNLPIVNKPLSLPFIPKNYANKFYGYQLRYELQINSNISCGK